MAVINGLEVDNLVKVVEAVKQKWETGKTVNAAVRGIKIHDLKIDLEGGFVKYVIMLADQMFCQQHGEEN